MKEMSDSEVPTVSFYFSVSSLYPACLPQIQQSFEAGEEGVEYRSGLSFDDIQYEVLSGKKCLIIFSVATKEELTQVSTSLSMIQNGIKDKRVMVIICLRDITEKSEEFFRRLGCSEVLPYNVQGKSLLYKIRRYLKILDQLVLEAAAPEVKTVTAGVEDLSTDVWKVGSAPGFQAESGVAAMQECRLKGIVKDKPFEFLEYDEDKGMLHIGIETDQVEMKESVDLKVSADHMSFDETVTITGFVTRLEESEPGKQVAVVLLQKKGRLELQKVRQAVEKRQQEVLWFFKKVKGTD